MNIFQNIFKLKSRQKITAKITHKTMVQKKKKKTSQKIRKQELPFLYTPHYHDLFYIYVKYHENILKQGGHEIKANTNDKQLRKCESISPGMRHSVMICSAYLKYNEIFQRVLSNLADTKS